jgi:hypothetical protein
MKEATKELLIVLVAFLCGIAGMTYSYFSHNTLATIMSVFALWGWSRNKEW